MCKCSVIKPTISCSIFDMELNVTLQLQQEDHMAWQGGDKSNWFHGEFVLLSSDIMEQLILNKKLKNNEFTRIEFSSDNSLDYTNTIDREEQQLLKSVPCTSDRESITTSTSSSSKVKWSKRLQYWSIDTLSHTHTHTHTYALTHPWRIIPIIPIIRWRTRPHFLVTICSLERGRY